MLSARVDNTVNPSFGFGGSRMEGKGGKGIHPIQRDLRLEKQSFDGTGSNTKSGVRTGSLTYQQSRQIRNPEIMFIHQFFDKKKQLFGMRRLFLRPFFRQIAIFITKSNRTYIGCGFQSQEHERLKFS